ncbi:hypothetical protein [Nocardia wallacei]|uniref:hypothetical protein n=1 Tax=Nocardia wallacei TaxID=480035 RepID=UPI0024549062|nr:hypothetical protein [Nocardia wallacei]
MIYLCLAGIIGVIALVLILPFLAYRSHLAFGKRALADHGIDALDAAARYAESYTNPYTHIPDIARAGIEAVRAVPPPAGAPADAADVPGEQ